MTTETKPRMTAAEATSFATYSPTNAIHVRASLACGCQPYLDVFTYRRWQAQGFQVQPLKGEGPLFQPKPEAPKLDHPLPRPATVYTDAEHREEEAWNKRDDAAQKYNEAHGYVTGIMASWKDA